MTHKKVKYKSGNMPFSVYSSSVGSGYAKGMSEAMGVPYKMPSNPASTLYASSARRTTSDGTAGIGKMDLDALVGSTLLTSASTYGIFGVGVDPVTERIYYSVNVTCAGTSCETTSTASIWTVDLDGANPSELFTIDRGVYGLKLVPSERKIILGCGGPGYGDPDYLFTASMEDGSGFGQILEVQTSEYALGGPFDYSTTTNKIYFRRNIGLFSCSLDGSDYGEFADGDGVGFFSTALSVDDKNQKLYWTVATTFAGGGGIYTSSLEGSDVGRINSDAYSSLTGLVVDPYGEKVFFASDGSDEKIYSCSLDGANETAIAVANDPWSLALYSGPATRQPGFDITNLHEDTYGGIKDAPLQGPFTYQYVGGNQHRHVPLNKGDDRSWNRPELFNISFSASGEIRVEGVPIPAPGSNPNYWNEYALELSGSDATNGGYVDLGTGLDFNHLTATGWAISVWVKIDSTLDHTAKIISKADGSNQQYQIGVNASGQIIAYMGGNLETISGDRRDDLWHNIVLTYDGVSKFYVYIDGVEMADRTITSTETTVNTTVIGTLDVASNVHYFLGKIDEVSFWNTAFVVGDVTELYNSGIPTDLTNHSKSAGLVTWLSMGDPNADLATPIVDRVGTNNGIITKDGTGEADIVALPSSGTTYLPPPSRRAIYTRGEVSKRPLNIANHKTYNPLGNYSSSYEIIQTVGRTSNNPAFVEQTGSGFIGDSNLPYSGSLVTQFVTGARDFTTGTALPDFSGVYTNKFIFVNRFNAPGGTDVSSPGVLDTYAEEYAPNNALPWRNYTARSVLRSDLTRHTPQPEIPTRNSPYSTPDTASQDLPLMVLDVPNAVVRKVAYSLDDGSGGDIFTASFMYTDGPASPLTGRFFDEGDIHTVGTANPDYANGIAVDNWNKKIYWTEFATTDDIFSASFDGSDSGLINLNAGTISGDVRGIAVSPYLGKVAWCNRNSTNNIVTSSLDGSDSGVAISNLDDPYDLVIDDRNNKVYWIGNGQSTGSDEKIWSASLDGSAYGPLAPEIQSLLTPSIGSSFGITAVDLDRLSNTLYILGDFDSPISGDQDARIHKCNLEGRNASLVYTDLGASGFKPIDLQIDPWGNRLYIAQFDANKPLLSCSLDNPGTGPENLFGACFTPPSSEAISKFALAFSIPVPTTSSLPCGYVPTKYHSNNRNTRYYKQTPPEDSVQVLVGASSGLDNPRGIALDISAGKMYWTDQNEDTIKRANFGGTGIEELVSGLGNPAGIALDVCADKMYWTDYGTDKIQRANLDGTGIEDLITSGLNNPLGIALDISAGKMYWTDFSANKIQRADMSLGAIAEDLITSGLAQPYGISLDISAGKMYWTQATGIQKANLDGTEVEFIIAKSFTDPAGIALDTSLGKVYWCDKDDDMISRANLDGTDVQDMITAGLNFPDGIALDTSAGKMYWTDLGTDKIYRANLPEKPVYDNGFITHAIPQCSLQYSWIKASAITDRTQLQGYQTSGSY